MRIEQHPENWNGRKFDYALIKESLNHKSKSEVMAEFRISRNSLNRIIKTYGLTVNYTGRKGIKISDVMIYHRDGMTNAAIAKKLGCNAHTIGRIVRENKQ